jgi:hypothetical protein
LVSIVLKIAESILILVLSSLEIPITFAFSQSVWRILPHPSPTSNLWAIELRDPNTKTVSWALLDLDQSSICWHTTPEATDWWTTLTAFYGGNLYLHNYRYPDIPEPTDLLAVSAGNGQLKWVLPGVVLVREASEKKALLVAKKHGEGVAYHLADPESGLLVEQAVNDPAMVSEKVSSTSPIRYLPGDTYFDQVTTFMGKLVGKHDWRAVDYVESNPYIAFSYYLYQEGKVAQRLLIINDRKEVVYHETLSENRQGIGRDTILLKAGLLLCLRNNNELISFKLRPQE